MSKVINVAIGVATIAYGVVTVNPFLIAQGVATRPSRALAGRLRARRRK